MNTKILIADDSSVCRLMLQSALRSAEHEVVVCADGDQAWHLLQTIQGPLLAILDWNMPGQDGPQLCQRIRSLGGGPEGPGAGNDSNGSSLTPVLIYTILLTGQTSRDAVVFGLQAGANDYITKPFDKAELCARVQVGMRVLELQRTLADRVRELEDALTRVKQLQGLLPICCYCKSIRADQNYWQQVDQYIAAHADVRFSHGICPGCYARVVEPQLAAYRKEAPSP